MTTATTTGDAPASSDDARAARARRLLWAAGRAEALGLSPAVAERFRRMAAIEAARPERGADR